ncbi:hypothetical protein TraAM80_06025 [Trypanosoma rangeli]|uniref:Uncharacterized protein n=1 Tax=Trypanosoma rangeli TaxID=5698 RepID=A0A3R7K7I4_TRYRA|nr:uncharacterized protein TraAM80_06025 [Trypanosoma rangeli]RNF03024.1 hypothetical protein TraAM80_06025 [Trypanosoma rangeli]|eukprot:RNF03024.1 hypothetical protein TraAM80_06025 [Trypanosoma rangeli]
MDSAPAASPGQDYTNNNSDNNGQLPEALPAGACRVTGALQARFVNQYNPMFDKPYSHHGLNANRYLNEELCRLLEDDCRNNIQHHLQTDKIEKAYMLARLAHAPLLRD